MQIRTNLEDCRPCPVFANFTLALALQLRKITEKSQAFIHIMKDKKRTLHLIKWMKLNILNCEHWLNGFLHSVHIAQCSYWTVFILHSVHITQCSYYTVFILHSVHITQCSYYTVFIFVYDRQAEFRVIEYLLINHMAVWLLWACTYSGSVLPAWKHVTSSGPLNVTRNTALSTNLSLPSVASITRGKSKPSATKLN